MDLSIKKPSNNTPPMVDFVVRSAYIDTRERNGLNDVLIFFMENVYSFPLDLVKGIDPLYSSVLCQTRIAKMQLG